MASNFNNDDQFWRAVIEYILTSDTVQGDPANLVPGSSFTGKINQVFQKIIDNLNWLRGKLPGNASTSERGIVQLINAATAQLGLDSSQAMTAAALLSALRNGAIFRASDSRYGVSQRASEADADTGTDNIDFITSALLKRRIDAAFGNAPACTVTVTTGVLHFQYQLGRILIAGGIPSNNSVRFGFSTAVDAVFLDTRNQINYYQNTRVRGFSGSGQYFIIAYVR